MKRNLRIFLLALMLFTIFGCGPKVRQDFDPGVNFSRLKTYSWRSGAAFKPEHTLADERIRTAVDQALAEKGFHRVDAGKSDFTVDYQYQVVTTAHAPDVHTGIGVGGGSSGVFGGIGIGVFDLGGDRDQATLTISIYDSSSGRLIWQGSNTSPVPVTGNQARIAAATMRQVDAVLGAFPPL